MLKENVKVTAQRAAKLFLRDWVGVDLFNNGDGRTSTFARALGGDDGISTVAAPVDEREAKLTAQFEKMLNQQVAKGDGHVYFHADCDYHPNDTLVELGAAIGMTQFPWKSHFTIEDYGPPCIRSGVGYRNQGDSNYLVSDGWIVTGASVKELLPLVRAACLDDAPEVAGLAVFEPLDTPVPGTAKGLTLSPADLMQAISDIGSQLNVVRYAEDSDAAFVRKILDKATKASYALYEVETASANAAARAKEGISKMVETRSLRPLEIALAGQAAQDAMADEA